MREKAANSENNNSNVLSRSATGNVCASDRHWIILNSWCFWYASQLATHHIPNVQWHGSILSTHTHTQTKHFQLCFWFCQNVYDVPCAKSSSRCRAATAIYCHLADDFSSLTALTLRARTPFFAVHFGIVSSALLSHHSSLSHRGECLRKRLLSPHALFICNT